MNYKEIKQKAKEGYLCKLPNFEGYFKWDYGCNDMIFFNKTYICLANDLDIHNREDFYHII